MCLSYHEETCRNAGRYGGDVGGDAESLPESASMIVLQLSATRSHEVRATVVSSTVPVILFSFSISNRQDLTKRELLIVILFSFSISTGITSVSYALQCTTTVESARDE